MSRPCTAVPFRRHQGAISGILQLRGLSWRRLLLCPLGLLALGCQTVDVGPFAAQLSTCEPASAFFLSDVWPKFFFDHYSCGRSSCDDASTGQSAFRLQSLTGVTPPLPTDPLDSWPDVWADNLRSVEYNLDCADPPRSPVLLVPENAAGGHGGGTVVASSDIAAANALFQMWLQ